MNSFSKNYYAISSGVNLIKYSIFIYHRSTPNQEILALDLVSRYPNDHCYLTSKHYRPFVSKFQSLLNSYHLCTSGKWHKCVAYLRMPLKVT